MAEQKRETAFRLASFRFRSLTRVPLEAGKNKRSDLTLRTEHQKIWSHYDPSSTMTGITWLDYS